MAWYSEEAASELKRKVAEESVRFANGEAIHYPINKLAQEVEDMAEELLKQIECMGILPVIKLNNAKDAVPVS